MIVATRGLCWLKTNAFFRRIGSGTNPRHIVHLCFIAVFLCSTFLTWREALELKNSYEVNQQIRLTTVAVTLDRQFQFSLDTLGVYRSMLSHALTSPIDSDNNRQAAQLFNQLRDDPVWQVNLNTQRSMPLNGVSDSWMKDYPLLNRDDPQRLSEELSAVLELSFILQFSDPDRDFHSRLWYISRGGFYLSSTPPLNDNDTLNSYRVMIQRDYFTAMQPDKNPLRHRYWTPVYNGLSEESAIITVSVPVDSGDYWFGVLAMDFSRESIHRHLQRAIQQKHQGVVLLLDRQQNVLASSDSPPAIEGHALSTSEKQQLKNALQQGVRGELRFGTRYLTWDKLRGFDGVIVNIQTLAEGLKGDQGRIVLVLILMWLLFSLILLGSYYAIIRLISKMMRLQNKLEWRANYDGLTRLYNRAAFFDLSERCAAQCQRSHRPLSLIQLDIDFFKSVNDNYGHQAGDSALSHVAGIITQSLRRMDIAGRVGGEEFCLLLPETQLEEAVAVAERIRHQLAQKELMISIDQTVILTASFGVASSEEQGDYQTDSLQSLADSRLYQAKQSGRNRVCWQS